MGGVPAAEGLVDREQLDGRERARVLLGDGRVGRTIVVARDDLLRRGRVQVLQVLGRGFARAPPQHDLVDDSDRRLRQNAQ